uniref:Uncharacterized protein n=1 Tax=Oryza sativa subsp. japonica TaxID=39947 RepID=Q10S43_ORYSJ|nr:hypothetical protein LOC_Os03g04320 [Oryza sativa Japonica Group]
MGWARLLFSSPLLSSRLSPLPLSNDSVLLIDSVGRDNRTATGHSVCHQKRFKEILELVSPCAKCLAAVGRITYLQVVNNSDQDYSHLPELDLSVMLNQGTLHQSQDQLLINHTSPVRSPSDCGVRYHRCLWSRGLRTMVETSTDLEGTLDQVSGIFSLWVDRAKWTVQGIPTRPRGNNYRKGSYSAVEDPIVAAGNTAVFEIGEKVTWVTEQPLMDILATWHLLCNVKY